jgi:serine/threonine protein kinase
VRRQVALKVPQPETLMTPEARKRFQREAHAAAGLDHPNIVPIYETGSVGSVTYIAAAYCPGPTLADWLARQMQPVLVRDAARLVATLARAVEHAHERGVLHRDLKHGMAVAPGTVLVSQWSSRGALVCARHTITPARDRRLGEKWSRSPRIVGLRTTPGCFLPFHSRSRP